MISIDTWIKGARPRTLPAAIAPVLVATALAKSHANIGRAALALPLIATTFILKTSKLYISELG